MSSVLEPAPAAAPRKSFRETQFEARAEAILTVTNQLLATKGYELMVMDDIASEVGIAKGSLYKHFPSKEALAAAVMIRLLRATHQALRDQPPGLKAIERIESLLAWTFRTRLAGGVPHLPSTSQTLRDHLMQNAEYIDELMALSDAIGELIATARADGDISAELDDSFVLFAIYARSCDPTLDFLKAGGAFSDDEIVRQMIRCTLHGLR
ncbi:MAG: helix-turn-helix domain-containing protein [Burkholderiaceae bacterium]